MKRINTILVSFLIVATLNAESLQSVYNAAGPNMGYDKYLILDEATVYTGGLGLFEGDIFVEGNGAQIDLESGGGIWIFADYQTPASLDIHRCSIKNGAYYALNYSGTATGEIINCNIINSAMGIQLADSVTVDIRNCNLIDNETYGIAVYTTNPVIHITYCNAWNNGENYMENCPG